MVLQGIYFCGQKRVVVGSIQGTDKLGETMKRLLAPALLALTLTGCGDVDATSIACNDFAEYISDGMPKDQRSEVVSQIGDIIGNADPKLQDNYGALTNNVNANEEQWTHAADVFSATCIDVMDL